ncbi:GAF and ANTAR domain-containing protein [Sphaerisporangium corydalis]|uniref:GAF and ANTAR domain-containing protein n=1 Tax=Sphaerisporangium corydalis TaxID=1441875 RepID=A0ABV9EU44_9ACTN|nr:GAF and ANTAR domain-containing protein [Sphaerisporangium corydalis]
MSTRRPTAVWESIIAEAHAQRRPVSIETVCHTCAWALRAHGVAVALTGTPLGYEPLCASGPAAYQVMEAHATLGEGPAITALTDQRPILVPDLAEADALRRWPLLAPAALETGAQALFALPMMLGAISVGVLEISRADAGWLSPEDLADALTFADIALLVHIQHNADQEPDGTPATHGSRIDDTVIDGVPVDGPHRDYGTVERWAQVHQATGIIAVQAGVDLRTAFLRLRAHAFAVDRSLRQVAADVIARRLRFPAEPR